MSNALVLGGGGALGAYQVGAIMALNELGYTYKIVTGTSVGALNTLLLGQKNFDLLKEIWQSVDFNSIIEYEYKHKNKALETAFNGVIKGGLSIKPLEDLVKKYIDVKKLQESDIETGIVYTSPRKKYTPIKIKEADPSKIHDYLLTSCSAIPFFQKRVIDGKKCYDGFYSDNLPVKLAKELGATKIIAIDILKGFRQKVDLSDIDYFYITPSKKAGSLLSFSNDYIKERIKFGYDDIMSKKEEILAFINK